jgi:uncharacterized protein YndB with AHSA1/START domain
MTDTLTLHRTIDAPAEAVFAVLAEPAEHAAIDGTGWLRESLDGKPITETGQVFRIGMYHDNHPNKHYEMANEVIAFEPGRVIAWKPGQANHDGELEFGGWTWRYDLEPAGAEQTRVTLTYDWTAVPATLREHIGFPPFPVTHLENSMANLARLAEVRSTT